MERVPPAAYLVVLLTYLAVATYAFTSGGDWSIGSALAVIAG